MAIVPVMRATAEGPLDSCRSGRPKSPPSCPSGLLGLKGRRSIGLNAIDHPWRRTGGRGTVVGGESATGLIDSGRPTLIAPLLRHTCDVRRVPDLLGYAFHNEIELVSRNTQGAPRHRRRDSSPSWSAYRSQTRRHHRPRDAPTPVTWGLPSRLIVANQQVCRSGPPVPGAWVIPCVSRSVMLSQSRIGRS